MKPARAGGPRSRTWGISTAGTIVPIGMARTWRMTRLIPDPFELYRDFLKGRSGRCVFTGQDGCHAFATEDEIEGNYGSRHDAHHFVWFDTPPEPAGYISDDHIDELLALGRIASTFCEMSGVTAYSRAGLKAAVLLGASRMRKILALPSDGGQVSIDAIDTLPLSLRWQFSKTAITGSIPKTLLIEKMIPLGATVEDGEARGRLLVLARAAAGADFSDIELEAEHWADWAVHCAEREAGIKIAADMLDQLVKDRGRLQ